MPAPGKKRVTRLVQAGVIAAMYVVLTMLIPAASFGPVQLRLSEALTVLPVLTPAALPGLTVGCLLSNLLGMAAGANPGGAWDLLIGPAATAAAAVLTWLWRRKTWHGLPLLACLPPVFINAAVIGTELTLVYLQEFSWPVWWLNLGTVAGGQAIACLLGGTALHAALTRTGASRLLDDL